MGNLMSFLPWSAPPSVSRTRSEPSNTNIEMSASSVNDGRIFSLPMADILSTYNFGSYKGRGQFGTVHAVFHKGTGSSFACKTVTRLSPDDAPESILREVEIMHHLSGHPNIVGLHEVIEDHAEVHLVMELCDGGDLSERTFRRRGFPEETAKRLFRQIMAAISYCHDLGVIHRDVKLGSFMFLTKEEDSSLKAIDFGFATFFRPGQKFRESLGTLRYISPQVAEAQPYGPEADIWSVGVVLYILLSGDYPFHAETVEELSAIIRRDNCINFSSKAWRSVSDGAKDLIGRMLQADPELRISAADVLSHPWVGHAGDATIDIPIVERMKNFGAMNKFKRVALKVIAENLSKEETTGLRNIFESIADDSGKITSEGMKNGLNNWGGYLFDHEVKFLMDTVDLDGDGVINDIEFISATMHLNGMRREERLRDAFQQFDKEKSGYITKKDINNALEQHCMTDNCICCLPIEIMVHMEVKEILADADTNKDGKINYDEFVRMILGND